MPARQGHQLTRPGPHRPRGRHEPSDNITPFTNWTSDLGGPLVPTAYNGSRYFNIMACLDTGLVIFEDIAAKSDTLDSLQLGMDWVSGTAD